MPAGRPKYEPKAQDRATVKALAAGGVIQDRISQVLGIDDKTLRKHFPQELVVGKTEITALAVSKIVTAIQGGEAWAICFWLKCREGWRETQAHEISGPNGAAVEVNVSAKELFLSRIASISERQRQS